MPYLLSPSTINLMLDCPKCFWLQFNKNIKRPEGIFPSLPSGMDKILKEHFDSYIDKNELPPVLIKHNIKEKLFSDRELLNKWRNPKIGITFKDEKGNILKGAVDNLLINGKNLVVLDYKTRGYDLKNDTHEHYRIQLDLYNFLLRKNNYETEDYSYLLFYHPDKIVENVFLFHTHLIKIEVNIKEAENTWKKALETLEKPIPESSANCEYCKYRETKINEEKKSLNKSILDY